MNANNPSRFTPILLALCLVAGILIGTFYANHFSGNRLNIINTSSNKVNDLLRIIDDQYVDTVDMNELVEQAMPSILAELDPHSAYIQAKDAEASIESLKGSFSGVGVSFVKAGDTARIVSVIKGGPSEKVGLLAGDRIVSVDGKSITGKDVTAEDCMKLMKGKKDTKVKLGIRRMGEKETLYYTVVRGDIPMHRKPPIPSYWSPWPSSTRWVSRDLSSTSGAIRAASCKQPYRWPTSSCPRIA